MILSTKSNHVVLVGVEIKGAVLVSSAAYVTVPKKTTIKLYDLITGEDKGWWSTPNQEYPLKEILPAFVMDKTGPPT